MQLITILLRIIAFAIVSFVLVHILSIFGFFIALAYPVLWFVAPNYTFNVLSRDWTARPNTLSEALKNTVVIFLISLLSLGVVIFEAKIFNLLNLQYTPKTATFMVPSKGQYKIGEIFPMSINVDSGQASINAVQSDLRYDNEIIEVFDISTRNSFATVFVNKEIDNDYGFSRLSGGLPSPGRIVNGELFGTVYFKAKKAGVVLVDFMPSSLVLANDGKGTNILKDLASVSYFILPEELPADAQAQQEANLITTVLGDTSDQLTFFDKTYEEPALFSQRQESIGTVLGSSDEPKTNLFMQFLTLLEQFDLKVIAFWKNLLRIR